MLTRDDLRFNTPLYTQAEAAQYVGVPAQTLKDWTRAEAKGVPLVHRLAAPTPRSASIPFVALAEALILRGLRREYHLGMREVRAAVLRLRRELGTEYALASQRLATDGVDILVDLSGQWERARDGQHPIEDVISPYLQLITYDAKDGYVSRLRLKPYVDSGADVIVDPRFGFGHPVLERSKIRVEVLLGSWQAGDSIATLAREYRLDPDIVEATLRAATTPAAPAA